MSSGESHAQAIQARLSPGSAMRKGRWVVGRTALACLLAVAPSALTAQTADRPTAEEVKKEVGEAIDALGAYSAARRDEALARARPALDRLDQQIERLEDRLAAEWDRMDRAARERTRAALKELRKRRTDLAEWSGRMRESSAGAWEQVRQGFVTSYRALADAFAKAADEFK
jgi:recombinational DNA repair ATPase RecF